jgi:UDP:flavonoid glycosyltransferase YjiC (YdhE family)
LVLSSVDASPFGPTITAQEKEEPQRFQASLSSLNDYVNKLLRGHGSRPLPGFFIDCIYTLPDLLLQLSVAGLEFPRSDMPGHIKFVGPVLPKSSSTFRPPDWWAELDASKPVVLVTQGTVANRDLNELIAPTLDALSGDPVMVIVATGKEDGLNTPIPSNARVTPFVPFMEVLGKVDIFVTNGGFGAVNQALSMGVPLVIAGDTEDKAFVAARVAWTGAGISLGTLRPTPEQVRSAVHGVLNDTSYRANAKRLQGEFAKCNALDSITRYVESYLPRDADQLPPVCLQDAIGGRPQCAVF